MRAIHVVLILLILIPAILNFYLPLYNYANPTFLGLPFFYWFQILLLALTTIPYLAFAYLARDKTP